MRGLGEEVGKSATVAAKGRVKESGVPRRGFCSCFFIYQLVRCDKKHELQKHLAWRSKPRGKTHGWRPIHCVGSDVVLRIDQARRSTRRQ